MVSSKGMGIKRKIQKGLERDSPLAEIFEYFHRELTQCVCVADCYFIVNVLDLPFASLITIYG